MIMCMHLKGFQAFDMNFPLKDDFKRLNFLFFLSGIFVSLSASS